MTRAARLTKPTISSALVPASRQGGPALLQLLKELAGVLLSRGITPGEFSRLSQLAFVQVAANRSRLRNGRVNHSGVAAQTGLSRAEVRRLLDPSMRNANVHANRSAVEKVITGWLIDDRFTDARGGPKRLTPGSRGTFMRLSRKYAGDVPYRAVLDELQRVNAVVVAPTYVQLKRPPHLRRRKNLAFLSPMVGLISDGLRIVDGTAGSQASALQKLSLAVDTEVDLAIVRERCIASARSMLEGLGESLGKQLTLPTRSRKSAHTYSVTVLLAESPSKPQRRQSTARSTRNG